MSNSRQSRWDPRGRALAAAQHPDRAPPPRRRRHAAIKQVSKPSVDFPSEVRRLWCQVTAGLDAAAAMPDYLLRMSAFKAAGAPVVGRAEDYRHRKLSPSIF